MGGYRAARRLLVALLVVGVSSGQGGQVASPAGALAPPAGAMAGARPWRQAAGLAATPWSRLASTDAVSATWSQQAELTSTAETGSDLFGQTVDFNDNTAVVGAPDTGYPNNYGAAYIFARSGSTWTQQAALSDPGGAAFDNFGIAVAVNASTAAIGAYTPAGGIVYVYGRSGITWSLQATLTPRDAVYTDGFGNALALSGTTLIVGSPGQNNQEGAVYVFEGSGSTWSQQAELPYPGHGGYAGFGEAVGLSGNTLVAGTLYGGAAFVYVGGGSTWRLEAALTAPAAARGQDFGIAVAVAGNTALVSACCARSNPPPAVFVYTRSGHTWTQQAMLSAPAGTGSGEEFGDSVALSGHTALVGGGNDNCTCVYVGSGSTWRVQAQLVASDRPPNRLGFAVALQGNTAVVGAGEAAYVFVRTYG